MGKLKRPGPGLRPGLRNSLGFLSAQAGLPFILGKWYFVDKTSGSDNNDGREPESAVAEYIEAYSRVLSGAGDGICLISRGT